MFFIVLTTIMTAIGLYVGLRLCMPLPIALWARVGLSLCALVCANKLILVRWLLPGGLAHNLPFAVLVLTAWAHITVVLMCLTGLALDLALPLAHKAGLPRMLTPVTRLAVVGILAMSLAAIGVHSAVKEPGVTEISITVPGLPPELEGLRVGLLADLHIGPMFDRTWVERVVALTNEARPDLVVIAGDTVDGTPRQLFYAIEPLRDLRAPYGAYIVMGNHEYYSGLEAWRKAFPELGLRLLYNEHAIIAVRGARIVLAGLADRMTLRGGYPGESTDIAKALHGAPPRDAGTLRLLVDHQPGGARANAAHDVDVQFSGHTHGGLALPIQRLVAMANDGFVSGAYTVGTMRLVVSNGAGLWAGMPLRLGVPGQILLCTLTRENAVTP